MPDPDRGRSVATGARPDTGIVVNTNTNTNTNINTNACSLAGTFRHADHAGLSSALQTAISATLDASPPVGKGLQIQMGTP
jgi:hypothetical protein